MAVEMTLSFTEPLRRTIWQKYTRKETRGSREKSFVNERRGQPSHFHDEVK